MIEKRIQDEASHYDKRIQEQAGSFKKSWMGDYPFVPACYRFLADYLRDKCQGKKILDYGCGRGLHSFWLSSLGAEITGIDLSEKSLEIARERKEALGSRPDINFLMMDCENLKLEKNYFDIVFEDGVFPSLDFKKALSELVKVLKPGGFVIGIETLGHNPITNLNRRVNKSLGKRTTWEVSHIFSLKDTETAKLFFEKVELYYFHPISWIVFPFLKFNGAVYALKFFEFIDKIFFKLPYLKKYSFKIVFIFSGPKKVL